MNFWLTFFLCIVMFYFNTSGDDTYESRVCSLDDIKNRIRDTCRSPKIAGFEQRRRRRNFNEARLSIPEPSPQYYFRVKRNRVKVICCTPLLIPTHGQNCIDYFHC